ncbi:MAG: hypothetical protein ABSD39_01740 [Terriglobales bacterium]|jgi:hypothetical protein
MSNSRKTLKVPPVFDHISDEILISADDGELTAAETAVVKAHLEACWRCRVRMEKIERAIEDLIDYRASLPIPYSGSRDGSRAIFFARLCQCASEFVPQPAWRGLFERLFNFASALAAPRIAWAGALLALSLAVFLTRVAVSPTVSANAILERARISEKTARTSVQHPVVYQKLRIHSQAGTVTRTIYHDLLSGRKFDSSDASQLALTHFETKVQAANFDWQDPLSIANFMAWHAGPFEKTDEVTRTPDGLVVVHTKVHNGPLAEVELTLRDSDYHAIGETLRFQNENVEMSEVDFSVLAFESVNRTIFESPSLPLAVAIPAKPIPAGPSMHDLVHAEAEARVALHILGADLGEPIDISGDGRKVLISGMVDSVARKQGLLHVLQVIPYIQVNLTSVDEAGEKAGPSTLQDDNPIIVLESAPLLDDELHAKFPEPEARTRFVNEVVETTMNAINRAWSLRRLSDRYTSDVSSKLDTASGRKMEFLIRDDAGLLQQELDKLQLLLTQLNLPRPRDLSHAGEDHTDPADWHWGVDSAFSESQRIQNDISVLFSGVDNHDANKRAILVDLMLSIARMDKRLPDLCQKVSGNFLTAANRNAGIQDLGDSR